MLLFLGACCAELRHLSRVHITLHTQCGFSPILLSNQIKPSRDPRGRRKPMRSLNALCFSKNCTLAFFFKHSTRCLRLVSVIKKNSIKFFWDVSWNGVCLSCTGSTARGTNSQRAFTSWRCRVQSQQNAGRKNGHPFVDFYVSKKRGKNPWEKKNVMNFSSGKQSYVIILYIIWIMTPHWHGVTEARHADVARKQKWAYNDFDCSQAERLTFDGYKHEHRSACKCRLEYVSPFPAFVV